MRPLAALLTLGFAFHPASALQVQGKTSVREMHKLTLAKAKGVGTLAETEVDGEQDIWAQTQGENEQHYYS